MSSVLRLEKENFSLGGGGNLESGPLFMRDMDLSLQGTLAVLLLPFLSGVFVQLSNKNGNKAEIKLGNKICSYRSALIALGCVT